MYVGECVKTNFLYMDKITSADTCTFYIKFISSFISIVMLLSGPSPPSHKGWSSLPTGYYSPPGVTRRIINDEKARLWSYSPGELHEGKQCCPFYRGRDTCTCTMHACICSTCTCIGVHPEFLSKGANVAIVKLRGGGRRPYCIFRICWRGNLMVQQ